MRSLEFVENRETRGCFGAGVEALTGVDQDIVHDALKSDDLYHSDMGASIASELAYDEAMKKAGLNIRFQEILPHFDPFSDNQTPLDDSDIVVETRLDILRQEMRKDDHNGAIIAFPCQRYEDEETFLHFIAAIEPQQAGAELTIMDPSELFHRETGERIGGVFHKSEEDVRKILTPRPEMFIPVCGWLVQVEELPQSKLYPPVTEARAELEPGTELTKALIAPGVTEPFIL